MIRFKKSGIMGLAALVVLGGVLAGCSGSSGGGTDILIPFTAKASFGTGTSQDSVSGGESDRLVRLTVATSDPVIPGGAVDGVIPAGMSVAANEPVGLFSGEQTLFTDVTLNESRAVGDVTLNGQVLQNVYVDQYGRLRIVGSNVSQRPAYLLLPRNSTYTLVVEGPISVRAQTSDLSRSTLTVGKVSLSFYTDNAGIIHLPHTLSGHLPGNGTQTPVGWNLTGAYSATSNTDGARLKITHANGMMNRTTSVVNSSASFTNAAAGDNDLIPTTGVDEVHYGQSAQGQTIP